MLTLNQSGLIRPILLAAVAAVSTYAAFIFYIEPVWSVSIPLPVSNFQASLTLHRSLQSEGRFELELKHGDKSAKYHLWQDWGPADQAAFYMASESVFIIIGGGFLTAAISLDPRSQDFLKNRPNMISGDGADWLYLGIGKGGKFFSSAEEPECIPHYGNKGLPFRKPAQTEDHCS